MAPRSLFSEATNSHEEAGPRIENDAPSCGLDTLRWWLRVLLSLGSLLGKVIERRGFSLKDLQSAWEDGSLKKSQLNLLDDILVLTQDGKLESGADAYLFVARRIWWAWPFYAIFRLPGFNWMLWQGYRWFNRNRYRISRHCPLPARGNSGHALKDSTRLSRDA